MKVLTFAASNNKEYINQKLATYVVNLIKNADVKILKINDYQIPIFSDEREKQFGHLESIVKFLKTG